MRSPLSTLLLGMMLAIFALSCATVQGSAEPRENSRDPLSVAPRR